MSDTDENRYKQYIDAKGEIIFRIKVGERDRMWRNLLTTKQIVDLFRELIANEMVQVIIDFHEPLTKD